MNVPKVAQTNPDESNTGDGQEAGATSDCKD
jgi:hypothetical protein